MQRSREGRRKYLRKVYQAIVTFVKTDSLKESISLTFRKIPEFRSFDARCLYQLTLSAIFVLGVPKMLLEGVKLKF